MNLYVLRNRFPKAFYFRSTEQVQYYDGYEAWSREFEGLWGVQGKALAEEKSDRSLLHVRAYTRFKQEHPEQMVLLHFNGNARDPEFQRGGFFAGHWLYTNGATVLSDVPDDHYGVSEVGVSDTSLFTLYTGRYFDRGEDLGLCELDAEGRPNWHRSEQVQLVAIDKDKGTITIRRGCHGTKPIGFEGGRAYVAPHVIEGPWNGRQNNLMWFYNYSTHCPRDSKGRTCADVLAAWLEETFGPRGPLAAYDGLEFDVLFSSLYNHPYYYLQGIEPGGAKQPDCDGDGLGDMGIFDGLDTYGVGVLEFTRDLRRRMGEDRLILADAGWWHGQRSMEILNGIESEGLQIDEDGHAQWGHPLNTHLYWNQKGRDPHLSYILLTKRHPKMTDGAVRIAMAAAVMSGSAIAVGTRAGGADRRFGGPAGQTPEDWDELVKGGQSGPGWLGEPLGPVVRMAAQSPDLLCGAGDPPAEGLLEHLEVLDGKVSIEDRRLRIDSQDAALSARVRLSLPGLEGPDLLVSLKARGEAMEGYPREAQRLMFLTATRDGQPVVGGDVRYGTKQRRHAYFLDDDFVNTFSWAELPEGGVDLDLAFETGRTVWIDHLKAHAAVDACYRVFENGLVLVNPSKRSFTFDVEAICPGKQFERIQGRPGQCPEHNNGLPVEGPIELGPNDAIFLAARV
jgi:hypothetical protein